MVAIHEAIRGDYALYAGGITIADMEYDERLGEVLRPIAQDRGGMPIGFDIASALKEDIRQGFFLDKIQLPEVGGDMTAFEVRRRLEEHIRASAPIYEPIEKNYNTVLCEGVFDLLMANGAFPIDDMPETLAGHDVVFKFRSPLADMAERTEVQTFLEGMQTIVGPAMEIDPAQKAQVNITQAVRDALIASGFKASWLNELEAVDEERERIEQQAQLAQASQLAQQVGAAAQQGGAGIEQLMNMAQGAVGGEGGLQQLLAGPQGGVNIPQLEGPEAGPLPGPIE